MNNLIKTKKGEIINMRLVMKDSKDDSGHTAIIRHVNDLEAEIEELKSNIKVIKHSLNKS